MIKQPITFKFRAINKEVVLDDKKAKSCGHVLRNWNFVNEFFVLEGKDLTLEKVLELLAFELHTHNRKDIIDKLKTKACNLIKNESLKKLHKDIEIIKSE